MFDDALPRNLLVISLDTTRRDPIGRFDATAPSDTPNLDAVLEIVRAREPPVVGELDRPVDDLRDERENPMENGFWPSSSSSPITANSSSRTYWPHLPPPTNPGP